MTGLAAFCHCLFTLLGMLSVGAAIGGACAICLVLTCLAMLLLSCSGVAGSGLIRTIVLGAIIVGGEGASSVEVGAGDSTINQGYGNCIFSIFIPLAPLNQDCTW